MTSIRALAFDLDGVLADSATLHYAAWKRLAQELGIAFTPRDNEALKGVDRIGSLRHILALGQRDYPPDEIARLAERKNSFYREAIAQLTPDALLDGAAELLAAAQARGLKLALASASRNAPELLRRLGIADAFDFVADPLTNAPKPAPDLFQACASAFGLPGTAVVGFEDAAVGIAAIKSAGMFAVGIGSSNELPGADLLYSNTAAVCLDAVLATAEAGRARR